MRSSKEHNEQVKLFRNIKLYMNREPFLILLHATPNAAKRSPQLAAYLKAEGMRAGVPDLNLPLPRGDYSSLWIELKADKKSYPTQEQKFWMNKLNECGCLAVCCYGWKEALDLILDYLNEEKGLEGRKVQYKINKTTLKPMYRGFV
jgi:hypothetical protein